MWEVALGFLMMAVASIFTVCLRRREDLRIQSVTLEV
jgi:hypothetical protein